jgi:hypothetical protein
MMMLMMMCDSFWQSIERYFQEMNAFEKEFRGDSSLSTKQSAFMESQEEIIEDKNDRFSISMRQKC